MKRGGREGGWGREKKKKEMHTKQTSKQALAQKSAHKQ